MGRARGATFARSRQFYERYDVPSALVFGAYHEPTVPYSEHFDDPVLHPDDVDAIHLLPLPPAYDHPPLYEGPDAGAPASAEPALIENDSENAPASAEPALGEDDSENAPLLAHEVV